MSVRKGLFDVVWKTGVVVRDGLKRAGLSGPIEPALMWLGPRLMPPPFNESVVELSADMRLLIPGRFPSYRNFVVGSYERALRRTLERFVQPGMRIVDVGANIGYYTVLFSKLTGEAGTVTAFEPDPQARSYLARNLDLNGCRNVTVVSAAVAATTGPATFVRNDIERGYLGDGRGAVEVDTQSLDDHFASAGWPRVELVKMDIEGGETPALSGMLELARRNPRLVLAVEYNPQALERAGFSRKDLANALRAAGFTDAHVVEQRGRHVPLDGPLPGGQAMYNLLVARQQLPADIFAS